MGGQEPMFQASAIILTGGRSSRMGSPKALLRFAGEPLILHVVRALQQQFAEIVVVAAAEQELPPLPATIVRDEVAYQGPVGGIYYGLRATRAPLNFVTSCDVPFLNLALIAHLIGKMADYDVAVPYWQGRLQPLHAVYRAGVASHLRAQLAQGELRPILLYDKVRTCKIAADEIRSIDPEGWSFFNMNTPADYQVALTRWQASRPHSADGDWCSCTVELFGVARLCAKTARVSLDLPQGATLAQVICALAERAPALVGPVIVPAKNRLASGHVCNLNGGNFVRDWNTRIASGDRILIVSADAGG